MNHLLGTNMFQLLFFFFNCADKFLQKFLKRPCLELLSMSDSQRSSNLCKLYTNTETLRSV